MGVLQLDEAIAASKAEWFQAKKPNGRKSTSWRLPVSNAPGMFVLVWADATKYTVRTSDPKGFFERCDDPYDAVRLGEQVASGVASVAANREA